jgi:hypothetical protein
LAGAYIAALRHRLDSLQDYTPKRRVGESSMVIPAGDPVTRKRDVVDLDADYGQLDSRQRSC